MKQKEQRKATSKKQKVRKSTGYKHDSFVRLFALYRAQVYERYYPVDLLQKDTKC